MTNGILLLLIYIGIMILCEMKGKPWFTALGLLFIPFSLVGAIRLAKPESYWDRKWYGKEKHDRTVRRYEPRDD